MNDVVKLLRGLSEMEAADGSNLLAKGYEKLAAGYETKKITLEQVACGVYELIDDYFEISTNKEQCDIEEISKRWSTPW